MREIRFRAWNEKNKIMVFPDDDCGFSFHSVGCFRVNGGWSNLSEVDPHKIMQFTGLKDKNGVEIYEGDRLDFGDWDKGGERAEIVWNDESLGWELKYHSKEGGEGRGFMLDIKNDVFEVIGNIYENPELNEKS